MNKLGRTPRHGKSKEKIHLVWSNMLRRCYDKTVCSFYTHGGRGIKVCKRWHEFEKFFFDMGDVPKGKSLDRINNNGNYFKSNCRWSSMKEQARNRRTNRHISFQGDTMLLCEWAEKIGISGSTIATRLHRGWSIKESLMGRSA